MKSKPGVSLAACSTSVAWAAICLAVGMLAGCRQSARENGQPSPPADDSSDVTAVAPDIPPTSPERSSRPEGVVPDKRPVHNDTGAATSGSQVRTDTGPAPPPQQGSGPAGETGESAPQTAVAPAGGQTWEPHVAMSQAHAATCLVTVGDAMPQVELPDLSGTRLKLADLRGPNLTLVVLWNSQYAYAREQYERLIREVVQPFGSLGVHVVAISVGDDPQAWQSLASNSEGRLTNLLDSDRSLYDRLATDKLPRTYLLDASGTILWLDIEYSRGTRRELENALRYYLKLES